MHDDASVDFVVVGRATDASVPSGSRCFVDGQAIVYVSGMAADGHAVHCTALGRFRVDERMGQRHELDLPEGLYPFVDRLLPLSEMTMGEAPPDLRDLIFDCAARNGIGIMRDEVFELRLAMPDGSTAMFTVWWPRDGAMHILLPKGHLGSLGRN